MSEPARKAIVVLGATGQQGGAVMRALLADGRWALRALSRDAQSEAARRLAARGVEVVAADMDDVTSLRAAFAGAYGVYSVQGTERGSEIETRRGIAVADAARVAEVGHFVYSSVGGADRGSGVPHFESKWRIEEHVRRIGLPASVVRPAFFMDNFAKPSMRMVLLALLRSYVRATNPLQMIAVEDIGRWVAEAFAEPERFIGAAEEIAGDALTGREIAAALKRHGWSTGLPFALPKIAFRPLPHDVRRMFEWFDAEGYAADIPALRRRLRGLLSFDEWLSRQPAP